jgi:hypothetical protein
MSLRLACPHCDAVLVLANPPPPGKKVRCPGCDSVFPYRADALQSEPPARRRSAAADDEYEEDRPRSVRRKQKPQSSSVGVVVALVAVALGGMVLAGGVAWAVFWKKSTPTVAEGPPAGQPAAEKPNPPRPWQPPPGFKPPSPPPGFVPPGGARPPTGTPAPEPPPGDPSKTGIAVGNTAQEIEGEDVDGKRFKLSDYRGKVVLLDFWNQF